MAIKYKFNIRGDLLIVTAEGEDESLEDTMNYSTGVVQKAIETNSRKVLCDERNLIYKLNTIDTYELAKVISKAAVEVARIAIVCNPESMEQGEFFETVSSNRGLIIRVTTDIKDAQKWLELS